MSFLRQALKNSNTTAIGLSMIAGFVVMALHQPANLQTTPPWLLLLNGIGFVFAADGNSGDKHDPPGAGAVAT